MRHMAQGYDNLVVEISAIALQMAKQRLEYIKGTQDSVDERFVCFPLDTNYRSSEALSGLIHPFLNKPALLDSEVSDPVSHSASGDYLQRWSEGIPEGKRVASEIDSRK